MYLLGLLDWRTMRNTLVLSFTKKETISTAISPIPPLVDCAQRLNSAIFVYDYATAPLSCFTYLPTVTTTANHLQACSNLRTNSKQRARLAWITNRFAFAFFKNTFGNKVGRSVTTELCILLDCHSWRLHDIYRSDPAYF